MGRLITRTALIFRSVTRTMYSKLWIFRMNFRHYIHQEQCSILSSARKLPDWKSAASLVRKIAENYKLPYYTMSPTYSICRNHGYLTGEQFKCPYCGEEAEVYSRITGYYRPVKNWNDGRPQEFKERRVYDITNSHMRPRTQAAAQEAVKASVDDSETRTLLFTTKTCPNCRVAASSLEKGKYSI